MATLYTILKFIRTKLVSLHIKVLKKIKLQKDRQKDRNILHAKLCIILYNTKSTKGKKGGHALLSITHRYCFLYLM